MAMRTNINKHFFFPAIAALLSWSASCSSVDEAPGGGRVEHPGEPKFKTPLPSPSARPVDSASTPRPSPTNSADPLPSNSSAEPGFERSPQDQAIANDHPSRPWSKNVPKRACTQDEQCGDGFCDRGRCAAIWSGSMSFGQRCGGDIGCGGYLCLEDRCRSCVADDECKEKIGVQDPRCGPSPWIPGAQKCLGLIPSIVGSSVGSPLPAPKK